MRIALKILFGAWALCSLSAGSALSGTATIFVLDATVQMSAKVGQQRKIDIAKKALGALTVRMDPGSSASLWAIGTSPAKKCEDRGELVPLQPLSSGAGAFGKALATIQPRAARAPLFGTIDAALTALGDQKDASVTAIVIAGTGDDCAGDICREAKRLHETFPNTKLSAFGIGMSEGAAASLTCAAKTMGGAFTAVKTGSDLERALRQTLDIATNAKVQAAPAPSSAPGDEKTQMGAGAPAQQTGETQNAIKSAPVQQSQPEPNAVLSAVMANGMPALEDGVSWAVFKINTTPTGQLRKAETPLWTGGGGRAAIQLAEGRYAVHIAYGYVSEDGEFTAGAGTTEASFPLHAGTVAAEALLAPGQQPATDAFFTLYRRKPGGSLETLGRSAESPAVFQVAAGNYVLSASSGLAKAEAIVKVEAGKVSAVRMALNAGTLALSTSAPESLSKLLGVRHEIYVGDAQAGSAPVLRLEGAAHRIQLPAGAYRVETILGSARIETALSIAPGETISKAVAIDAGEARVLSASSNVCTVYDANAGRGAGPIGRAAGTDIGFILKAGLYDLECRPLNASSSARQTQLKVVTGQTTEAKF